VLQDEGLQAVCKIVLKDREVLCAMDPFADTMLLSTLFWPDEVRDVNDLDLPGADVEFKPAEIAMAKQLVDAMTGDFDATQYRDEYREALLKVIAAKVEGEEVEAPEPVVETKGLVDLMAVLEASVAAARKKGSDAGASSEAPAKPAARKTKAEEPVSVDEARKQRATRPAAEKPAAKATGKATATKRAPSKAAEAKVAEEAEEATAKTPARRRKSA
jgi:DNA end-binding protein Ku